MIIVKNGFWYHVGCNTGFGQVYRSKIKDRTTYILDRTTYILSCYKCNRTFQANNAITVLRRRAIKRRVAR